MINQLNSQILHNAYKTITNQVIHYRLIYKQTARTLATTNRRVTILIYAQIELDND